MRIVIKIGSNIIADAKAGLNARRISSIATQVAAIRQAGHEAVIVSSGAVAAGTKKMGLAKKPVDIMLKQAAAATGQASLMWTYEKSFHKHKITVAQVLLTRDGLANRKMYINAKNTLNALLEYGVLPIINENDTVATEEIRFGDNDQLAALVASLCEAGRLIILSDVDGLYSANPQRDKNAKLIPTVTKITDELIACAGDTCFGSVGTGGMYSKVLAAQKAVQSGISVNIINGRRPAQIAAILGGKQAGTEFAANSERMTSKKGWIAYGSQTKGSITLDEGAVRAVVERGKSLLPSGIVEVSGSFQVGDAINCMDRAGKVIAKGLANYKADDVRQIAGKKTTQIESTLGFKYSDEVIHRDNMVLVG